jgi:hypothetical protein
VKRNGWSWGFCTSETCNHNSHDPYMEGDVQFVYCRPTGVPDVYELEDGRLVEYVYSENGHYAPTALLRLKG